MILVSSSSPSIISLLLFVDASGNGIHPTPDLEQAKSLERTVQHQEGSEMEGYNPNPCAEGPQNPRFGFRAPGQQQLQPQGPQHGWGGGDGYQGQQGYCNQGKVYNNPNQGYARNEAPRQSNYNNIYQEGQRQAYDDPNALQGYYYRGRGPPRPPFRAGYRGNVGQSRGVLRPPVRLSPVDLTRRVVIPQPRDVDSDPNCNCERKVDYVICTSCGFLDESGRARKRISCTVHPKRVSYTDLKECPKCKSDLEEHEPQQM